MKNLLPKLGGILLAAAMLLTLLPFGGAVAQADSSYPSKPPYPATIPVEQTVSSGSGTFTYTLSPEDSTAPMPEGTENGKYTFTITGNNSKNIVIESETPGTWYYTLVVEEKNGFTYDATKYRLGVQYYTDGDTLKANINALADGATEDRKADKVDFKMAVKKATTAPQTPARTPGAPSKAASVKTGDNSPIALYAGLLAAAALVLIVALVAARRRRNRS